MAISSVPGRSLRDEQRARILLVEDEVLIRAMVADALRDEGYEVIEAFNGDEAIALLAAGLAVDLILTDVRMPGATDGLGLLNFSKMRFPGLPVILTSGHLEPGLAVAKGATHYLGKPYKISCALELVAKELARQGDGFE